MSRQFTRGLRDAAAKNMSRIRSRQTGAGRPGTRGSSAGVPSRYLDKAARGR